jgi:hypothetical protein
MARALPVPRAIEVTISVGSGGITYTVRPSSAFRHNYSIHVHRGTPVVWKCACPFAIVFNGPSPLDVPYVVSPTGAAVRTIVRRNATSGAYKFTTIVSCKGNILVDDPEIIVD